MAQLGTNVKVSISKTNREAVRALFEKIFGCAVMEPAADVLLFEFRNSSRVGVYFLEPDAVLTPAQNWLGAWIEIAVDDLEATRKGLAEFGIETYEYMGETQTYYKLPGGQCFRICSAQM